MSTAYHESTVDLFLDNQLKPGVVQLLHKIAAAIRARKRTDDPVRPNPEFDAHDPITASGFFSEGLASSGSYCSLLLKKVK